MHSSACRAGVHRQQRLLAPRCGCPCEERASGALHMAECIGHGFVTWLHSTAGSVLLRAAAAACTNAKLKPARPQAACWSMLHALATWPCSYYSRPHTCYFFPLSHRHAHPSARCCAWQGLPHISSTPPDPPCMSHGQHCHNPLLRQAGACAAGIAAATSAARASHGRHKCACCKRVRACCCGPRPPLVPCPRLR